MAKFRPKEGRLRGFDTDKVGEGPKSRKFRRRQMHMSPKGMVPLKNGWMESWRVHKKVAQVPVRKVTLEAEGKSFHCTEVSYLAAFGRTANISDCKGNFHL